MRAVGSAARLTPKLPEACGHFGRAGRPGLARHHTRACRPSRRTPVAQVYCSWWMIDTGWHATADDSVAVGKIKPVYVARVLRLPPQARGWSLANVPGA